MYFFKSALTLGFCTKGVSFLLLFKEIVASFSVCTISVLDLLNHKKKKQILNEKLSFKRKKKEFRISLKNNVSCAPYISKDDLNYKFKADAKPQKNMCLTNY